MLPSAPRRADKKMHGIFEATCAGTLNINPSGWTGGSTARTAYPAQVRVAWYAKCAPLPEAAFRHVIADNYFNERHFHFELTAPQATALCALFRAGGAGAGAGVGASPARPLPPAGGAARAPGVGAAGGSAPTPAQAAQRAQPAQQQRHAQAVPAAPAAVAPPRAAAPAPGVVPSAAHQQAPPQRQQPPPPPQQQQHAAPAAPPAAKPPPPANSAAAALAIAQTHAAAAATLSQLDPSRAAAVEAHLDALCAAVATLRVEAASASACASADATLLREQLAAARADAAAAGVAAMRVGAADVASASSASSSWPLPPFLSHVYTLGGYDGTAWLATMDCLAPAKRTWAVRALRARAIRFRYAAMRLACASPNTRTALLQRTPQAAGSLTSARGYCAAAPLGHDALYVLGGGNGGEWFDTCERFDIATRTWRRCAPLSLRRGSLAAASPPGGGAVFAFGGGFTDAGGATLGVATSERYDAGTDTWAALPPLSHERFCLGGATLGGALYAVGGFDGKMYLSSAERYDPREGASRWTLCAPMASKRGSLAVAASADGATLIAAGGFRGDAFLNTVEVYEARKDAWRPGAALAAPRAYGAAASADGAVCVLGGLNGREHALAVEVYDARRDAWRAFGSDDTGAPVGGVAVADAVALKRAFVAAAVVEAP
jgi:hypothetical protein